MQNKIPFLYTFPTRRSNYSPEPWDSVITCSLEITYLITEQKHSIPISDLSPESIKYLAKKTIKNPNGIDIKHTTILNLIANTLGVPNQMGFQEYEKYYKECILPFIAKNGLKKRHDLITCYFPPILPGLSISYRNLSKKLFDPNKPIPEYIFTGFDFEWDKFYHELSWDEEKHTKTVTFYDLEKMTPEERKFYGHNEEDLELLKRKGLHKDYRIQSIDMSESPMSKIERYENLFNLTGDQLLKPYCSNPSNEVTDLVEFRKLIESSEAGWVKVLPMNDRLIFLKGGIEEAYDFIFKGQVDIWHDNSKS